MRAFCRPGLDASPQAEDTAKRESRIRVWDLPTRCFHWSLALACLFEWLTQDDARYLDFHVFVGYAIGGLVVLRCAWGVVGTRWARFRNFAYAPHTALHYLVTVFKGRQRHYLGHNPAGSWSIYALLTLAAASVISGIAALGGEKQHGPLRGVLSFAQGDTAREIHEVFAWTLLGVVIAHVLGVVLSSIADRENLALAMISGSKRAATLEASVPRAGSVAIAMLVALTAAAAWYFRGYFQQTPGHPNLPFNGPVLAEDPAWQRECGSCHEAYHPSLLPARSWTATFAQQHEHFGEDLALDDSVVSSLSAFATEHSAEHAATPAAWKFDSRTPRDLTPLRITDTPYWKRRHRSLGDAQWKQTKKIDCGGCHFDAELGTFEPGAIAIGGASIKSPAGKG